MRTLYWVRNDLRLHDNETLQHFVSSSKEGLLLWFENYSYRRALLNRKNYIDSALAEFQKDLQVYNLKLAVSHESIYESLEKLISEYKFDQICFTQHVGSEELSEEKFVESLALKHSIKIKSFDDNFLVKPNNLPFELNKMPMVFTDFRKKLESQWSINKCVESKFPEVPKTLEGFNSHRPIENTKQIFAFGEKLTRLRTGLFLNYCGAITLNT